MNRQSTSHILMVRPAYFGYNSETESSNAFQQKLELSEAEIEQKVLEEFDAAVTSLKNKGVVVNVLEDTAHPPKYDAVFPNNWGSYQEDGSLILYPMEAPNRRLERRSEILDYIQANYEVKQQIDLTAAEADNRFLEGTGSIVFDHPNQLAYTCISSRTDEGILQKLCEQIGYRAVPFHAVDRDGMAIYHTNVMMCIGSGFAVVCMDSIPKQTERDMIETQFKKSGHELISISYDQLYQFAGNLLEVENWEGKKLLALSQTAFNSLDEVQKEKLGKYCELLPLDIKTIETQGGGSVRCMIAEVFLNPKN